jgi:hypothetical protein
MKTRWFLAAFVAAAMLMFAGGPTFAQDRHDRDDHEHHWDRDHPRFDDHERVIVNGWWGERHERPIVGFRVEDRLPRDWEPRLQVGLVFDGGWRARLHPVPDELYRRLPPPPPHFTYYVVGGHVVLVDRRNWRVADVIHIEL